MFSEFNPPNSLLTPILPFEGVSKRNPLLTSNNVFPTEEHEPCPSSIPPTLSEYESITNDHLNENGDSNQQHYDLLSTFELPVLTELEDFQYDKYLTQPSGPMPSMEEIAAGSSDESMFYPIDDAASNWIGSECTVESQNMEDMEVPPSPAPSSTSNSSMASDNRTEKKRSFTTSERKLRKKDQNKAAAEKYRMKKKSERNELTSRHADLKNQNQELKFELENLSFRVEQFKQLFVDVLQIPVPTNE